MVTPVASVARWAAQPIELGHPGWDLKPLVLGPAQIPVVASAAEARAAPELAVLSALAHGPGARGLAVAKAVCEGLLTLDIPRKDFYLDLIWST